MGSLAAWSQLDVDVEIEISVGGVLLVLGWRVSGRLRNTSRSVEALAFSLQRFTGSAGTK